MGEMQCSVAVRKGDSLSRIAERYGVSDWRDVYDAPGNAAFRQAFPDPDKIDYVSHDGARAPVHLCVPTKIRWTEQPVTPRILKPGNAPTPHEPMAPTGTELKVEVPEPGVLRHQAKMQVPSEWELRHDVQVSTARGAVVRRMVFVTQVVEWDIRIRGGFGVTPEGKVKLGAGGAEGKHITVTADGESLAFDLLGVVSMEVGKIVSMAVDNGSMSFGLSSEGGQISFGATAKAPRAFQYPVNGAPHDVSVTVKVSPVVSNVLHLQYGIEITPTEESLRRPVSLGKSTITMDVYVQLPEPVPVPVPVFDRAAAPAPEESPGFWVRVKEALAGGYVWVAAKAGAVVDWVVETVTPVLVAFVKALQIVAIGVVVVAAAFLLAELAVAASAALAVVGVGVILLHVSTRPAEAGPLPVH
jgi:hypothetical protein